MRPDQMTADREAMLRGFEAVWLKALGYITAEPYRSRVREQLAHTRFRMATHLNGLTSREALRKLAEARAASRETVSMLNYALACTVVVIPGARQLVRRKWMGPLRRLVAGLISYRKLP